MSAQPEASQLRSIVERIEHLDGEIAELNSDKKDVFAEAKANGFDVKALKAVLSMRRKDPSERAEHEAIVELYLAELGMTDAGLVHVHARGGHVSTTSQEVLSSCVPR